MTIKKNIFGKLSTIDISEDEFRNLVLDEAIGYSMSQWFSKFLGIHWMSNPRPKDAKNKYE